MRMGKQVNFYAAPDDINALIEFVISKKGGCCLSGRAGTGREPVIEQFAAPVIPDKGPFVLLARKVDLGALIIGKHPVHGYWYVSQFESPVIECTFPVVCDGELPSSRLWFQTDSVTSEFIKWADSIHRWVRKHCERVPVWWGSEFVGRSAKRLLEAGEITLRLN
jgi:hypothetical protein